MVHDTSSDYSGEQQPIQRFADAIPNNRTGQRRFHQLLGIGFVISMLA
jgi:hypothetical protein